MTFVKWSDLANDKSTQAAEAGKTKTFRLFKHEIGDMVGELAPEIRQIACCFFQDIVRLGPARRYRRIRNSPGEAVDRVIAEIRGFLLRPHSMLVDQPHAAGEHAGHRRRMCFISDVIRLAERDRLREACAPPGSAAEFAIPSRRRQRAYKGRLAHGPSGLGVTERAAPQILSLPQLADEAVDRVIAEICGFLR